MIWVKFPFKSYFSRVAVTILLLILLSFGLLLSFVFVGINRYILENTYSSSEQIVSQLTLNLDQFFEEIDKLTIFPLYENDIVEMLKRHSEGGNNADYSSRDESMAQIFLLQPGFQRSNIKETLLFALDGRLYSNFYMGTAKIWGASNQAWMERANEKEDSYFILPPQRYEYYSADKNEYISVARLLRRPITLERIGYVKIDIYPEKFASILKDISFSENSLLYVMTEYDELLYPIGASEIPRLENGKVTIGGKDYISQLSSAADGHIQILALISVEDMQHAFRGWKTASEIALGAVLLAAFFLTYMISWRLSKPIVELSEKMQNISEGHFDTRIEVTYSDEVGQLQQMFNEMAEKIDPLFNEVLRVSLLEKNARIAALQSQINPHFLYNTLETINMMAVIDGDNTISEAVTKLGQLLHYAVDNDKPYVTIREELEQIQIYSSIQELRNSALEPLKIDCALDTDKYMIPKLLLQPFVENIIDHADYSDTLIISISIEELGENMRVSIQDNGLSDEQTRLRIKKSLAANEPDALLNEELSEHPAGHGYGLKNVQKRLKLLYGDSYGVYLDETYTEGTRLVVMMKMLQKDDVK